MWPAVVNGTVVKRDTEMWKVLAEWSCSLSLLLISASTIAWIYPGQCAEDILIILITLGKKRWWQQQLPDIWWSHWWPISPQGNQQSTAVPWMNADEVSRRTTQLNLVYIADPQNHKVTNDHFRDYVSGWFFCKKSYMAHSVGSLLFSKNIKWKVSKYIYRNGQEKTEKHTKNLFPFWRSCHLPAEISPESLPTWADFFISRIGSIASSITNLSWIYTFQVPEFPFSSPETAHS